MAWNDLKAAVAAVIKTNETQSITGALLQSTLSSIIDQVGANSTFKGIAIPSTNPGVQDGPVFYFASVPGVYANFSGISVAEGDVVILSNTSGSWTQISTGFSSNAIHIFLGSIYMKESTKYLATSTSGESLNGGISDITNSKFTIPIGVIGNSTYIQKIFGNSQTDGINTHISSGGSVRVLLKLKFNESEPSTMSYGISGTGGTYTTKQIAKYLIGGYVYVLMELSATVVSTNPLKAFAMYTGTTVRSTQLECTLIDYAMWVSSESLQKTLEGSSLTNIISTYLTANNFLKSGINEEGSVINRMIAKMSSPLSTRSENWGGQGLNGGTVDFINKKINIPTGLTGSNSYVQPGYFQIGSQISQVSEGYLYGIMSVRFSRASDADLSYISTGLRKPGGANINLWTRLIPHPNDPNVFFILSRTDKTQLSEVTQIYYPLQIRPSMPTHTSDRTFEILDSVLLVDLQSRTEKELEMIALETLISNSVALSTKVSSLIDTELQNDIRIQASGIKTKGKVGTSFSNFSGDPNLNGLATMTNIAQSKDQFLKKIKFYASTAGVQRFGIGTLDQRSWGIIEQEFELNMIKGWNEINVLNLGLIIPQYQQLFAYFHYGIAVERLTWGAYTSTDDTTSHMLYGISSVTLGPINTTYGGYLNMQYEVADIDSMFASKGELTLVENKAENAENIATEVSNNLGIVSDRSGLKYKLIVVDGVLQIIPLQYKKVLVISNSYGLHGRVYSYGWCGTRGMASSIIDNDFVHLLQEGLRVKDNTAVTNIANVASWERDFNCNKSALLDTYLTSDVDCIVFRAGENVSDTNNFQTALIDLMNYCFTKVPTADGYICSMLLPVSAKDAALFGAATALNLKYVNCGVSTSGYTSRMGYYTFGDYTPDGGITWDTNQQVLYPITYAGVAGHPGDMGMLKQANSILAAMQYNTLGYDYTITVVDAQNIGYTCFNKWVKRGVFNIHTTATSVIARDANNNPLSVTNHNDGVFTFIMPDSNVTITISN